MEKYNQEWYGTKAKVMEQGDNYTVVDYGCEGHGFVTTYYLMAGIQLHFLDFDTPAIMPSQKFNSDIITISHCCAGRYECEFPNQTMAYLPEGYFSVNGTEYLPVSFSFPLGRYRGLSLVIDKQLLIPEVQQMMNTIPVDLGKIGTTLGLEKNWYVSKTPPKLRHLFLQFYEAEGIEQLGYFKIKAIELLYHIDQLTQNNGCDFKYYDKGQIQIAKDICHYMITHLDEKVSLEELTQKAKVNLSLFHMVFNQIYGDTPYAYLKKYKMNIAARWLAGGKSKISDIAAELGYSNASKFAKAFQSVYGQLPKDYRKSKKQ